jgi:hypothetical protein
MSSPNSFGSPAYKRMEAPQVVDIYISESETIFIITPKLKKEGGPP